MPHLWSQIGPQSRTLLLQTGHLVRSFVTAKFELTYSRDRVVHEPGQGVKEGPKPAPGVAVLVAAAGDVVAVERKAVHEFGNGAQLV